MAISRAKIERRWEAAQESLVLQSADLSLGTLRQMVDGGQVDIAPKYQRRERWDEARQSSLIESFLLNVPVPPLYLAEESIGRFSVIDGKQRLTAIHRFLTNDLRLSQISTFTELEGARLEDFPPSVIGNLEVRPLRAVTLLKQSDPDLKYEVFTRLNRNGQPLLAQEIRNVLYRGPLNDLIFELSDTRFLHQQMKIRTKKSDRYKKMEDVELVLRFFTLLDEWNAFSGDYRRSMDRYMAENERTSPKQRAQLALTFNVALDRCEALWDVHAFRRPEGQGWRDQDLAGLYDAEMIAAHSLTQAQFESLAARPDAVIKATRRLFRDSTFEAAVRTATNTPQRVHYRVSTMTEALRKLAG